ncbi:hypothetical protein MMC25_006134 [Agyrium rufum]|nr:hypothetical protein [Agyrium rufum]
MSQKCVHKGCGKRFDDPEEECVYHPGPPEFHEGQKGWKCCPRRVLTFDEFLAIEPCTKGKHSTVDDTPQPEPVQDKAQESSINYTPAPPKPISTTVTNEPTLPRAPTATGAPPAVQETPSESDSDDASLPIPAKTSCRRRACNASSPLQALASSKEEGAREGESECVFHPGHPIFHEGSKGWTCCKRRVLEFDEFMRIEGCTKKGRHMFVGSGGKRKKGKSAAGGKEEDEVERVENVRHDFYQTPTSIQATLYLKKIQQPPTSEISFPTPTSLQLSLRTSDKKLYATTIPLFGAVKPEASTWKIFGTKIDFTLAKADGQSWPVLRSDERLTGEIIQVGKAGRA